MISVAIVGKSSRYGRIVVAGGPSNQAPGSNRAADAQARQPLPWSRRCTSFAEKVICEFLAAAQLGALQASCGIVQERGAIPT